jgi:hypothetical protein
VPVLQVSVAGVVQVPLPVSVHPDGQVAWAGRVHCEPVESGLPTLQVGVA